MSQFNKISSLNQSQVINGIVCASAGNHAQGFAVSCSTLGYKGKVFMPTTTPNQKIEQVKKFGKTNVEVVLHGENFTQAYEKALIGGETSLILSPDSEFFKFFGNIKPKSAE